MSPALADSTLGPEDSVHLDFALGKARHDMKDHAAAFALYGTANALRAIDMQSRGG